MPSDIDKQDQTTPETAKIRLPKFQFGSAKTSSIDKDFDINTSLSMNFYFAQTNGIISSVSMSATSTFGFEIDYSKLVYLRSGVGDF
jgi:hypothetical protein